MDDPHKTFIEELQSLDEPTKKNVIIVATAVIMVIIIYFWLAYFNNLVAGITAQPPVAAETSEPGTPAAASAPTPAASAPAPAGPGIFEQMGSGLAAVYYDFTHLFSLQGQYIVKPQ